MKPFEVVTSGYGLIEGPTIDEAGNVWFSDVTQGGVYRLNLAHGQADLVVPRRRYVGGICAHLGGVIITGRDVTLLRDDGSSSIVVSGSEIRPDDGTRFLLFSDLCADKCGRLFVGVPRSEGGDEPTRGQLVMITGPGEATVVADAIRIPNGMALSDDGTMLFQSDSAADEILCYSLDGDTPRAERAIKVPSGTFPDGLATDVSGGLWVACYEAGYVLRIEPEGDIDLVLDVPAAHVTNVCFCGPDFRSLLVSTADHEDGLGGCLLRAEVEFTGSRPPLSAVA